MSSIVGKVTDAATLGLLPGSPGRPATFGPPQLTESQKAALGIGKGVKRGAKGTGIGLELLAGLLKGLGGIEGKIAPTFRPQLTAAVPSRTFGQNFVNFSKQDPFIGTFSSTAPIIKNN